MGSSKNILNWAEGGKNRDLHGEDAGNLAFVARELRGVDANTTLNQEEGLEVWLGALEEVGFLVEVVDVGDSEAE